MTPREAKEAVKNIEEILNYNENLLRDYKVNPGIYALLDVAQLKADIKSLELAKEALSEHFEWYK